MQLGVGILVFVLSAGGVGTGAGTWPEIGAGRNSKCGNVLTPARGSNTQMFDAGIDGAQAGLGSSLCHSGGWDFQNRVKTAW